MTVPFVDLAAQYRGFGAELDEAIHDVLEKTSFILGPQVSRFEQAFAEYCGTSGCVGVGSGLDALTLALEAAGVEPGDEVITAANTFVATAFAISRIGATPVLVDCREEDFNLDPALLEEALSPRTRAVVPVHLFGRIANMEAITAFAEAHGLFVLEDAAQAHGARTAGRRAGSLGDAGAFSFYPAKNLGCAGDGGAVTSSREDVLERVHLLRNYGQIEKNRHDVLAVNSRLDSVQAAILDVKLGHLDQWNEARRRVADAYRDRLTGLPLVLPSAPDEREAHVYHLFVIRVAERDRVREELASMGIQTGVHYPTPVHLQPAYSELGLGRGAYPVAERLAHEILSLPMYPELDADGVETVARGLEEVLQ